ncbi:MAG: efflux RND transporter periplasmic adaptor subunit [Bacteroidales bacterium]|jgi:HlyD family secretion protein|nr:HlyD family efflux transporter periplasmic adaptor subunit [Bacteroidales bacterium]
MSVKKTIKITGIIFAVTSIALFIFNRILTKEDLSGLFAEAQSGRFEITVLTTGELEAENSIDIKGPEIGKSRNVRSTNLKIADMVPEGTEVKEGDFVASLDKTEFENTLRDVEENLTKQYANLEMVLIDTSLTMNNLRDQITNQIHIVNEAEIKVRNSQYETPTTQRQAEISYDKAKRDLDQLRRSYVLSEAQTKIRVRNQKIRIDRLEERAKEYRDLIRALTITAPSPGMITYKKDRLGRKIKAGSNIDSHDRTVATLPDLSSMLSRVYVSEIEVSKVKTGQSVHITIDALPDKSFSGKVITIANIGEVLTNSDSKVFEVLILLDGSDLSLRPSMTTTNKIIVNTLDNVTYIPKECVHTGADGIPVVYTKNKVKQVVVLGEMNDKDVVIEKGIDPGTVLYVEIPAKANNFRISGEELIDIIQERANTDRTMYSANF